MATLERSLGLWEVTLMSVGVILGAGVYVLIGKAAGLSGNALWLSFVLAAAVASLTGLSYAELASRFPKAGAEYVYVHHSFGETLAWMSGWLIIAGGIIGGTAVAMGFANYFFALFGTPVAITAVAALIACGVILLVGIKETAFFTILFTVIEVIGLVIIIFIGLPYIGSVNYLELAHGVKGAIEAGVLIFFSYIGFESITRLAEETREAEKNIPRAIILSIAITTVIYILVGIAAVSAVPWQELAETEAPLAFIAERVLGEKSFLVLSLIALFSTFNTVLVMLLSASRMVYGIAEQKTLPRLFLSVSKRTRTPWAAIFAVIILSMAFLLIRNLEVIANLTNFTIFVVFIMVNASVIYLRYKEPIETGFHVPLSIGKMPVIPLLGVIVSLFMLVNLSVDILLLGAVLIAVGMVVRTLLVRKNPVRSFKP